MIIHIKQHLLKFQKDLQLPNKLPYKLILTSYYLLNFFDSLSYLLMSITTQHHVVFEHNHIELKLIIEHVLIFLVDVSVVLKHRNVG